VDLVDGVAGTTLPAAPVNGQEYYYVADSTNGVVWHLKYRTTSAKWEYVGGAPLFAEVTAAETTTSTSYTALATAGPSIAVPVAGDYMVGTGCYLRNNTASSSALMSYDIGGSGAVDNDAIQHESGSANAGSHLYRTRRKAGLTAVTLTAKYRAATSGTALFLDRYMTLTPIKIG